MNASYTYSLLVLGWLAAATSSFAAGYPILTDTNQLAILPPGIRWAWNTNLYEAQTLTFITTNWIPIGPPVPVTEGGKPMRRQYESATLLTNISHRIVHDGVERIFTVSQTLGPVISTRHNDFPPPLPEPLLAVPTRNMNPR